MRPRRSVRCLLAILAAFASTVALAASPVVVPGLEGPFSGGNFVVDCGFAHRSPDDPIVSPGVPGAAHDHSFFGNETTDAFSTASTLVAGRTLCHRPQDRSAYWVPTMIASPGRDGPDAQTGDSRSSLNTVASGSATSVRCVPRPTIVFSRYSRCEASGSRRISMCPCRRLTIQYSGMPAPA
jgi:hypothetical protein